MTPDAFPPRRVLVVAYYFPPMGLSGVQRTLKFVKYLPAYGWHPTVLTVEPRGYIARDESLLAELDSSVVEVVRTAPSGPARLFSRKEVVTLPPEWLRKIMSRVSDTLFIPDNKVGWARKAVAIALRLHAARPFDLVFSTAPPFTDFLIGKKIKDRINRPLVLDYRDPWVDYPFKFYPTPLHKWRNIVLERRALRSSSHVVTTNRRVKEILIRRYPFLGYHDIDIIPQGYDPADFVEAQKSPEASPSARSGAMREKMRVTYAGIFWEDRVPDYFLRAIAEIFREQPSMRGRIEAVFVGTFRDENRRLVQRLNLQDAVTVLGYKEHHACIAELLRSDVLWMVVGDDLGSPGKAYEYIGAGKPILGCVPEGFMKTTIEEAGGVTVGPRDTAGIKKALLGFYAAYRRGALRGPSQEVINRYNRRSLTGSLVRVFESLLET